jgi:RNA polymerase sigma-70 factor (ECF subfamily)
MNVDPSVVRACQRGEPGALDELIRVTYADVYALCRRMLADPEEAADVTQEVFVRVMRSVLGFRGDAAFGTWLHRVTVNACLSALRRRSRQRALGASAAPIPFAVPGDPTAERLPGTEDGPAEQVERRDLAARAAALLDQLPEDSRTVVVLRDLEGLSTKEVADLLEVSEGVVKVRLCRAHARLRRLLAAADDSVLGGAG